ncbi:MAG: hypothetical protein EAZ85_00765 [Bacteroidetes bacterium]|nr:MAG: hypothetical protein EAZ85_00765 [Bacteroidota bacterium]TAG89785.1 MAG: hypothetical protein EAZ20_05785 [Bacteroidota bacterium]
MCCFYHQITYTQQILTFEEAEKKEGTEKILLQKILDDYFSVNDSTKKAIFHENMAEQRKFEKYVSRNFFSEFKKKVDKENLTKQIKSGFEFDYVLFFNEKGVLDYLLYSIEPQSSNYKLSKQNKKIFHDFVANFVKNYETGVTTLKKYKIYQTYIQKYTQEKK